MWIALGIIAAMLLIAFWRRRSAVWGGFTIGITIGIIAGFVSFSKVSQFGWLPLVQVTIAGTILGFLVEMLPKAVSRILRAQQVPKKHISHPQMCVDMMYYFKYKDKVNPDLFEKLSEEYKTADVRYEPIRDKIQQTEQEALFSRIDTSNILSTQEKLEAITGLMMILDGSFPPPPKLFLLSKIFGNEFVHDIEKKSSELRGKND